MNTLQRALRRPARELLRALVDLVFPAACGACGLAGAALCDVCRRNLLSRPVPGCPRCGEPAITPAPCGADHVELRHIALFAAPFRYAGTGGALVRRFKLDADAGAGLLLARAMARHWAAVAGLAWRRALLVPVPLHARRRRERGFDQARWLCRALSRRLECEVLDRVLVRRRYTTPQGDPRVTSRTANVEDAFAVVRSDRLRGRRVVLVDDVLTSGATARACALQLRDAGASDVAVLVACRS